MLNFGICLLSAASFLLPAVQGHEIKEWNKTGKFAEPTVGPQSSSLSAPSKKQECELSGGISEGFKVLEKGDSSRALEIFNAHARKNPASAEVHFGRAKALLQLGRNEEAAKEFKLTLLLEPNKEIARNCKEKLGIGAKSEGRTWSAPVSPSTVQAKDVESSVSKILSQSEEKIKSIQSGSESYANGIYNNRLNALNRALEQSKKEHDEMRHMRSRIGRRSVPTFSEADIRQREQEVQFKHTAALERAKSDFESRRREAESRAVGIKESAEGLESQMVNKPSETSGVFLVPTGTNLYVRNYGHFDPVMPEPPEALQAVPLKLPQVIAEEEREAKEAETESRKKRSRKKGHSHKPKVDLDATAEP